MSSVIVAGDTSGSVTLQAPAVAGTTVLTLPTTTGTLVVNSGAQTIEFADGSASAPSITNSGDTNTGIFFPAADTIAFSEGGVESMRIDSSGNLAVGVSPFAIAGGGTNKISARQDQDARTQFTVQNATNGGSAGSAIALGAYGTDWIIECGSISKNTNSLTFTRDTTERMRIDSSGNLGLGVTPSAWNSSYKAFQNGSASLFSYSANDRAGLAQNAYIPSSGSSTYINTAAASQYLLINNSHNWYIAPSGTAGNAISFTHAMTLDASGNLLVGTTSGSSKIMAQGNGVGRTLNLFQSNGTSDVIYTAGSGTALSTGESGTSAVLYVTKATTGSRSINAAGTINASGADYAEYMTKADDFVLAKGDVVGINAEGKLTNVFAEAVSFVVKSTDPSYVGGDTWGSEETLGLTVPEYPVRAEDDTDETFAEKESQYTTDKAVFDEALEAARQLVDRIAFAGQVPVNVLGATAGQYIIPVNDNGAIKGEAVTSPTFEQYQAAVGKVIAIEADGRAKIIVKVA
jgi:hypothetical protein